MSGAQALTPGAVETSRAGVPTVGREGLRAVVAGRAGEAGGLACQVVVGAGRARLGEAGPLGAEMALGTGTPLLRVAWGEEGGWLRPAGPVIAELGNWCGATGIKCGPGFGSEAQWFYRDNAHG